MKTATLREFKELGQALRDPAVTILVIAPLALIHLSGLKLAPSGAFNLVQSFLTWAGQGVITTLGVLVALTLLWVIGRIRQEGIAWRGGSVLLIAEGIFWGACLGPFLDVLTDLVPLSLLQQPQRSLHGALALAAGAGLWEELLFRVCLMGGSFVVVRGILASFGLKDSAKVIAFGFALLSSSALFAWAHGWSDPDALVPSALLFRFFAGCTLAGLYTFRGLAVTAWAHASYDAFVLL
ncbi:MAG: CPBP family glutamic-type intramembrane protease [Planctomycetes bacterium]|nr:CPBP family glutamic-type intramembrane protease [Planctomycetota bacterium]